MSDHRIAKARDFRAALEHLSVEQLVLPASGLSVLLCRPPVFAALAMARTGTELQARITEAKPESIKTEDIEAFTQWLSETLKRLFTQPRFAGDPTGEEIGLADIHIEDLRFIFRWLRGEVFSTGSGTQETGEGVHTSVTANPSTVSATEDLGRFPGGQRAADVPGGGGKAELLPSQRTIGAFGHAGLSAGLHRG